MVSNGDGDSIRGFELFHFEDGAFISKEVVHMISFRKRGLHFERPPFISKRVISKAITCKDNMVDEIGTPTEEENKADGPSRTEDSIVDDILGGERQSVFTNKNLVDSNTIVDHDRIYGRDDQLAAEARAFRDTLDGERPPDLLLYGPSGTGKSLTVKAVAEKVKERAQEVDISFDYVSVNFRTMESYTLDRAVWKLGNQTAKRAGVSWDIPQKGVSTDAKYVRLYDIADRHFDALVFILDEIDALTGRGDEPAYSRLLYSLSRVMAEQHVDTLISTVVVTNSPRFKENLDSRSDSSYVRVYPDVSTAGTA
jgi:cell division control protein 6